MRGGPTGNEGFLLLFYHIFLLIVWSWAAGYVVGYLSPKTVWLSTVLCFAPTFLCLDSYPLVSLEKAHLYWFLFRQPSVCITGRERRASHHKWPPLLLLWWFS